jgi:hypothetical protein
MLVENDYNPGHLAGDPNSLVAATSLRGAGTLSDKPKSHIVAYGRDRDLGSRMFYPKTAIPHSDVVQICTSTLKAASMPIHFIMLIIQFFMKIYADGSKSRWISIVGRNCSHEI